MCKLKWYETGVRQKITFEWLLDQAMHTYKEGKFNNQALLSPSSWTIIHKMINQVGYYDNIKDLSNINPQVLVLTMIAI